MGQMATAILYGVPQPRGVFLLAENDPDETTENGLLELWAEVCEEDIQRYANGQGVDTWGCEHLFVPDTVDEGEYSLMGFWVAVGRSGKLDIPGIETVPLAMLAHGPPYGEALGKARAAWYKFETWARTQGVVFPEPTLYLTEVNVT